MNAGQTVTVNLSVQNEGQMTWPAGGATPVHLGYHWYRLDGTQYVQAQADDRRTALPADVPQGAITNLTALLTAPRHRGSYVLKWDLVQEGVTWFAAQGAPELAVTVVVEGLEIDVVPSSMSFLFTPDATQTSRQMTITPAGVGTLQWTATTTAPWLRITPTSGTGPSVTTVEVDPALVSALPLGTHLAAVRLNWVGNAATPVDVPVAVGKWATLERGFIPAVRR